MTHRQTEEGIIMKTKECKRCKHEMTEAGEGSIAFDRGECFGCCGVAQFIGERIFGGRRCSQADHDMEAVEEGNMTEEKFFKRNPKAVGIVTFEEQT